MTVAVGAMTRRFSAAAMRKGKRARKSAVWDLETGHERARAAAEPGSLSATRQGDLNRAAHLIVYIPSEQITNKSDSTCFWLGSLPLWRLATRWSPPRLGNGGHYYPACPSHHFPRTVKHPERRVKPQRADDATRWVMATLSRMFASGDALWNVKPDTLIRWHRKGFRLFWPWPTGRPRLPKDLRQLIRDGNRECDLGVRNNLPTN